MASITGVENYSNREREVASLCVSLSLFGDWALIGSNLHNFMARPLPCHDRDAALVSRPIHCLGSQKDDQTIWRNLDEVTFFGIRFDKNGDFHDVSIISLYIFDANAVYQLKSKTIYAPVAVADHNINRRVIN